MIDCETHGCPHCNSGDSVLWNWSLKEMMSKLLNWYHWPGHFLSKTIIIRRWPSMNACLRITDATPPVMTYWWYQYTASLSLCAENPSVTGGVPSRGTGTQKKTIAKIPPSYQLSCGCHSLLEIIASCPQMFFWFASSKGRWGQSRTYLHPPHLGLLFDVYCIQCKINTCKFALNMAYRYALSGFV